MRGESGRGHSPKPTRGEVISLVLSYYNNSKMCCKSLHSGVNIKSYWQSINKCVYSSGTKLKSVYQPALFDFFHSVTAEPINSDKIKER